MKSDKFKNCIIVSDIDGTYLNDLSKPVERNLAAIAYFKENGGHFTFATGRTVKSFDFVVPDAKELCNLPAIACNGSYLLDLNTREKQDEVLLDYDKALPLFLAIKERYPDTGMRIIIDDNYIPPFMTPEIEREMEFLGWAGYYEIPFAEMPPRWNKAVYVADNAKLLQVRDYLDKHPDEAFEYCFSSSTLLEIQPSNGTKGTKLAVLKQYANLPDAKIYAIGDHENDLQMLLKADFPVTPENGIEKLKSIPNMLQVCSNNDGAIAGLVEEIEKSLTLYQV